MDNKKLINEEFNSLLYSEELNEIQKVTYKYGAIMLYYTVTRNWWDKLQKMIPDSDVVRVDGVIGREKYKDAHVTILYGLHKDVTLDEIKETVLPLPVKTIVADKVTFFSSDKYDVIKFSMDYVFLKELNKDVRKLKHTKLHHRYSPHLTVAYVKKGKGKFYCDLINKDFKQKRTLVPNEYVYSTSLGKKHKFKYEKRL